MQDQPILHKSIPFEAQPSLPGIQPLKDGDWLWVDEVYAAQMALRDQLIANQPEAVHHMSDEASEAARELLALALDELRKKDGFIVAEEQVTRPDGRKISLDWSVPLLTLGQISQADYCILQKPESSDEHILTAAILCFPSSWMLSEKAGRPLTDIHIPVPQYDAELAKRVQRLFDGVQVGRPLWRANTLWHSNPTLHQPKSKLKPRRPEDAGAAYRRSERQVIFRLPESGAVVFSIHTFQIANPAG
ncbi:heme-dependent oxidative N-demethylase family protein [Donghicola tyrosinivorans]|uniref:Uncharacterized protein DUF3445 n=1 Tax=Donghicola tyrosinivorans TaxID=1652492 RepID=A0A2T0WU13_9RHOB|nr:DUF3445 domain-containing protein [Donghicola tyrosinivorans]PRY90178.1 uncharacterized protein DUF3445 [Donghicola tyrosinivorans]